MASNNGAIKLVAGNSNPALAEAHRRLSRHAAHQGGGAALRRHGDFRRDPGKRPRRRRFRHPVDLVSGNDHLMELLIIIDALRRASARRITAVIPYFGYARQDRKPGPRTPISAKLVANLITSAGADRVLTLDLHAGQIQGFFDIPTDNLFASPVMVRDIKQRFDLDKVMVVSPDVGGVVRARGLAKRINAPLAIVDKRRERPGESEVDERHRRGRRPHLHPGRRHHRFRRHAAQRRRCAAGARRRAPSTATSPTACSRAARSRASPASNLKELVITDSIQPTAAVKASPNIRVLSIAHLIGEAISRTAAEESVSSLFFD